VLAYTPAAISLPETALESLLAVAHANGASEYQMQALCVGMNKWAADTYLLRTLASHTEAVATSANLTDLRVWLWLAQAAVRRGGKAASDVSARLLGFLMQPPPSISDEGKISWTLLTLSGFRMLLEPLPVLLKSTGARVGPLTSQRLVSAWLPKLRSAHSASAPSSLAWHASLQAMVHVITSSSLAEIQSAASLASISLWLSVAVEHLISRAKLSAAITANATASPAAVDVSASTIAAAVLAPTPEPSDATFTSAMASPLGADVTVSQAQALKLASQQLLLLSPALCTIVNLLKTAKAEDLALQMDVSATLRTVLELMSNAASVSTLGDASTHDSPNAQHGNPKQAAAFETELLIDCIDCITAFGHTVSYHLIFPLKRTVLQSVKRTLDHRKRTVRSAARAGANQWHMLSTSTT